jgi:outer membrane scaffolding protein for murein synthesis (MipA/OmpV family)
MTFLRQTSIVAFALGCAAVPIAARAWGTLLLIDKPPETRTLSIGPSVWSMPTYPGSRGARALLIPGFDYYAPNGFFASTDTAVGWNLTHSDAVQAGVRLWPQFGREGKHSPPGINSVGTRLQAQGFFNVQAMRALLLQSTASYGAGARHDGGQVELGATSGLPIGQDLLGVGVAASYANHAYRQSYFSISPSEAIASGLPAATMPYGWQDVSLTFSGEHRFSEHWRLSGQVIAARLVGAAARSPLTQSRGQLAASMTLWRDF